MHIHSFSKVLGLPLAILAVAIAYVSYEISGNISVWIFLPVMLLVVVYVLHGPIDHWWLSKYPVPLDPKLKDWLIKYFPYYHTLSAEEKEIFDYRMTLYLDGRLFKSVGSEQRDVPEDIKCMVAAHGILMSLHHKDYLIGDIDRIFLYKHPFPTPRHQYLHNVEVETEDGVIILSLEQLTNALIHPNDFINIGFYAYAESFIATQKNITFPVFQEESWSAIETITSLSKDIITQQIGLNTINLTALHMACYFVHRERYAVNLPTYFGLLNKIFLY